MRFSNSNKMFVLSQNFQSLIILLVLIILGGGGRQSVEGNDNERQLVIVLKFNFKGFFTESHNLPLLPLVFFQDCNAGSALSILTIIPVSVIRTTLGRM